MRRATQEFSRDEFAGEPLRRNFRECVWVFYVNIVPDLPELGSFTNVGSDLLLKVLLFVAVATVLAASAMFLVRLIGQALD